MKYEVRFIVENEERSESVDVENAAEAVEAVRESHASADQHFELIQVTLLEELEPEEHSVSEA